MIVVSDTTPLNYLILLGYEKVLPAFFGRVIAPPAVMRELQHDDTPPVVRAWAGNPLGWLEVLTPVKIDPTLNLGAGETEAISLAKEPNADAILMDERLGRREAQRRGLFATETLGVIEVAAEKGHIELHPALLALQKTSFRVSQKLINEAIERDVRRRKSPGQGEQS